MLLLFSCGSYEFIMIIGHSFGSEEQKEKEEENEEVLWRAKPTEIQSNE